MERKNVKRGDFIKFIQKSLKRSGFQMSAEDISRRSIGRPDDLLRPFLIDAVKKFQERTNKLSLLSKDNKRPLKWMPNNITIGNIDNYFAEGCPEIEKYQEVLKPKKLPEIDFDINSAEIEKIRELRPYLLRRYAVNCGLRTAGLEERKVKQCFSTFFPSWDQPIFDLEDEINDHLCEGLFFALSKDGKYIGWITEETSVGELMDVFIDCLIQLKMKKE